MPILTPFDLDEYIERIQTKPCFICEMIAGRHAPEDIIYQDDVYIAFLSKYPTLYGYAIVSPITHKEQVTGDFALEDYLALQTGVYRVAEAIRRSVPTERVYILSLGSQQGNKHVHWHIAPLPFGVPFKEQQLEALSIKRGFLEMSVQEKVALIARIRSELANL